MIIVHGGYDTFGCFTFSGGPYCRQVQVTVDPRELRAGLDSHPRS